MKEIYTHIKQLLKKYNSGHCTNEEKALLEQWYHSFEWDITRFDQQERLQQLKAEVWQQLIHQPNKSAAVHRIHFLKTTWFRYAAAVIVLLGIGGYLLWSDRGEIPSFGKNDKGSVVRTQPPSDNKAILTLADGSQIILDDKASGNIAQQGNTQIIKLDGNQLTYNGNLKKKSPPAMEGTVFDPREAGQKPGVGPLYNTITTPRGSQYQIILPDGTKAWLNAASSIKFPTTFTGKDRKVEVTGEIFFEVAVNKTAPFFVSSRGINVQVLGTSFNMNAYTDEEVAKTTLVSGSVRVGKSGQTVLLTPGQQAIINDKIQVQAADINEEIAWKNGLFKFDHASIQSVMRQLARWYNLEVVYEGKIDERFISTIPRNAPLSEVLSILEMTKAVNFKLEGNKVIVTP